MPGPARTMGPLWLCCLPLALLPLLAAVEDHRIRKMISTPRESDQPLPSVLQHTSFSGHQVSSSKQTSKRHEGPRHKK
ncbi:hypothetical protein AV530_006200 [Patagioenas fasciata monilis]|uniref:Uncharacterized protein n=1 Tax=Patagioenas fasciata monilis TaxID=372326 RepID=A0A1V4KRE0_PATFA|nr:hypothetical protein AV530_006200 [Patagioenas fasciata monilis]